MELDSTTQSGTRLCKDCENINFEQMMKAEETPPFGSDMPLWRHPYVLDWIYSTKNCPLCDIFVQATVLGPKARKRYPFRRREPTLMSRRASCYFNLSLGGLDDFMVLGIGECYIDASFEQRGDETEPRALLLPTNARNPSIVSGPLGQLIKNPIEWTTVKQWMSFCDRHHSTKCVPDQKSVMLELRFIDCETLQVVLSPRPPPPYITLSYLWGRAGNCTDLDPQQGPILDGMPLIVEDAIQVVKMLGYRYLWVDRYCIPQGHGHEKYTLIHNMDRIYRSAALNVIANGEENSRYGLPGVGSIPRVPQPTFRIGTEDYALCWLNTRERVEQSEWNKRGWTFQEGLLSMRKLVFTETQVYFQCNEMLCLEMVSTGLSRISGFPHSYAHDDWKVFPHHQTAATERELYFRIAEYRTRNLTYTSDRYNAFQGILHSFRQMHHPVETLYGVPIYRPERILVGHISTNCELLLFGLCWGSRKSAFRNEFFPSWTWVGWEVTPSNPGGNLENAYLPMFDSPEYLTQFFPMTISVEFADGTSMPWEEGHHEILQRSAVKGPPPCLTISGTVFDIDLSIGQGEDAHDANLRKTGLSPLPEGWSDDVPYFDHPEAGHLGGLTQCLGLLSVACRKFYPDPDSRVEKVEIRVLYFSTKDSSSYERIGVGKISIPPRPMNEIVTNPTSIGLSNVRTQTVRIV